MIFLKQISVRIYSALPKIKAPQKGPMKNISLGAYFRNFTVIYELVLILINVQIQSQKGGSKLLYIVGKKFDTTSVGMSLQRLFSNRTLQ